MVARTRFDAEPCPVARSIDAIGDWWSLLIVRDAFDGSRRFGQFQRSLGIAKNILTSRLRTLEETGVMTTVPASDGSRYQEYVLSRKGARALPRHCGAAPVGRDALLRPRGGALPTPRPPERAPAEPAGDPLQRRAPRRPGRDHRRKAQHRGRLRV